MRSAVPTAAAGLLLALASPALCQVRLALPETFADYDLKGAGRIGFEAWAEHDWRVALARYDANHDGEISREEYVAGFCQRVEADLGRTVARCPGDVGLQFAAIDRNHDSALSVREYRRLSANFFRENDRNRDGYVTREEMAGTAASIGERNGR
jgi:hypothetical protein